MAWHECPHCGSHMERVRPSDYPNPEAEVESCPDEECPYHVRGEKL